MHKIIVTGLLSNLLDGYIFILFYNVIDVMPMGP